MSKLIRKDEALDSKVFSRDLREYVVPVRELNRLCTFDEPEDQQDDLTDIVRVLFNRCYAQTVMNGGAGMCFFCGIRDACYKMRTTGKKAEEETCTKN